MHIEERDKVSRPPQSATWKAAEWEGSRAHSRISRAGRWAPALELRSDLRGGGVVKLRMDADPAVKREVHWGPTLQTDPL